VAGAESLASLLSGAIRVFANYRHAEWGNRFQRPDLRVAATHLFKN
jgi:hypothetical protein